MGKSIKMLKGNGLEAWRRTHYSCSPKAGGPTSGCNRDQFQARRLELDDLIDVCGEVAQNPFSEDVKVMGLTVILPEPLATRVEMDLNVPIDDSVALRAPSTRYCARSTA